MRKFICLLILACSGLAVFAQSAATEKGAAWSSNPYDREIYIENNGQYNGIIKDDGVLYSIRMGRTDAYFTKNGVTYQNVEMSPMEHGTDPDQGQPPVKIYRQVSAQWVNSNPAVTVDAQEKQDWYCTYDVGNNNTVKAWPYKRMTYHNLYAGIDAEYTFRENCTNKNEYGPEYDLIVRPGADLTQVKIKYSGVHGHTIKNNGDVVWTGEFGAITDHAPVAYYQGEEGSSVPVSYQINGDEETFYVANYDKTKTLVIDPWSTSPAFTTLNTAYEMDYDYAGNVYVYGGVGYELVKFNPAGVIQWMFTATTLASTGPYIGGMTTDKHSENCYLSEGWNSSGAGARSEKVNTAGTLLGTDNGNSNINEMWRLRWEPCQHFVWGVGNGTCCPDQAAQIDTSMVTETVANICAPAVASGGYHDFGSMCTDYAGGFMYTMCSLSLVYTTVFNNYIVKCPIPGLVPAVFQVPDHFAIHEWSSYTFGGNLTNGFSGMAASPNWLYIYQGDTVKQVNLATGAIVSVKSVSATPYTWGGIDADYCDNVYIGNNTTVQEYSSGWALLNSYAAASTIYDVKVNTASNLVYACGAGYAAAITNTAPSCVHANACNVPLPIEMGPFDCHVNQGTIVLNWNTLTETNNKYFTVERSEDGITFSAIGTVPGSGNSTSPKYYFFTDESPLNSVNYYRLSQTDMDGGTTDYSVTSCNLPTVSLGNIYPNPSTGRFSVIVDNSISTVQIYNALGQKVYEKNMMQNSGSTLEVDLSSQPDGMYMLNLIQANSNKVIAKKIRVYPR